MWGDGKRRTFLLQSSGWLAAMGLGACVKDEEPIKIGTEAKPEPLEKPEPKTPPKKPEPPKVEPAKRVVIYGATGRVGSRIVTEALDRGLYVTGVIHKTPLEVEHDRLTKVKGNILDAKSIAEICEGHGTVINAAGGAAKDDDPQQSLALLGAKALVEAVRGLGDEAPRIIFIGGSSTLLGKSGKSLLEEMDPPPSPLSARLRGHLLALEYFRTIEDVKWTVATPPRGFSPGERTGTYRFGEDEPLVAESGEDRISMEDFAAAVIDEMEAGKYVGKRFTVAY